MIIELLFEEKRRPDGRGARGGAGSRVRRTPVGRPATAAGGLGPAGRDELLAGDVYGLHGEVERHHSDHQQREGVAEPPAHPEAERSQRVRAGA